MNRRSFLTSVAVGSTLSLGLRENAPQGAPSRTTMGVGMYSFPASARGRHTMEFLEYCHGLGAGGIQAELESTEPEDLKRLRARAEALGMYLEVVVRLPGADTAEFERIVRGAVQAGALCLRTACLSGRRYEAFTTLEQWNEFVAQSKTKIERALPILEKHRIAAGVENHKDWTVKELVELVRKYSSEYLGVCLDTGNNIALLDDPMTTVERLAPYAVCTHMKDMAVAEYPEGFLLSEVPLGQGFLDLRAIVETLHRTRPKTKLTLEMITRDPLKIPCLTDKYWATFSERSGQVLARALAMVRSYPPAGGHPLATLEGLDRAARSRLEEEKVKDCLVYARDRLGLREAGGWR